MKARACAALEALQRLPNRRVAPMILKGAFDEEEPEDSRIRSIRAMASFPAEQTVAALTELAAGTKSSAIGISCGIVLRSYPAGVLRRGLLPLLKAKASPLRRQAAIFMAEFLGSEPAIRKTLHDLWRRADEDEALDLVEMMRILAGDETIALLKEAIYGAPIVGYAAATAISRMRADVPGKLLIEVLRSEGVSAIAKQALLDRWANRGPDGRVKDEALPLLLDKLVDPVMNVRYLAAQVLVWYPLERTLARLLDLLANESDPEIVRVSARIIGKGLSNDPLPLVEAVRDHPQCRILLREVVEILKSRRWEIGKAAALLDALSSDPVNLDVVFPEGYTDICVHLYEHGTATLQDLWPSLARTGLARIFLQRLVDAIRNPRRIFPPLPIPFLELHTTFADDETRRVLYAAMAVEGRREGAEFLAAALLRERDPASREEAKKRLRSLLEGSSR